MGYENLHVEREEGIAVVTVSRPAKFGELCASQDAREGSRAFLEKRAARFEGR